MEYISFWRLGMVRSSQIQAQRDVANMVGGVQAIWQDDVSLMEKNERANDM